MANVNTPLRQLLDKKTKWHWDREQEESFNTLKSMVSWTPLRGYYNQLADASSKGLGAVILQEGKHIAYGSRALTATQERYAQTEKEHWQSCMGPRTFHQYILGKSVH